MWWVSVCPHHRPLPPVHLPAPWQHPSLLHCCWSVCHPKIPSVLGTSENHLKPSLDYMLDAGVLTWANATHKWSLHAGWHLHIPHPSSFTFFPFFSLLYFFLSLSFLFYFFLYVPPSFTWQWLHVLVAIYCTATPRKLDFLPLLPPPSHSTNPID